jgi:hypothetical protein
VIVADVPTGPKAGMKEMIVGGGAVTMVKLEALVFPPAAAYTWIGPVVAPARTTAVAELALAFVGVTRLDVLKYAGQRRRVAVSTVAPRSVAPPSPLPSSR